MVKGKYILQMASICGKYETEREIVEPFRNRSQFEKSDKCNTIAVPTDFEEVQKFICILESNSIKD